MAGKVDLEVLGVIENMSGFTTPDGQRFTIFGEGGGQPLADELDVPLLGKIPLQEELREHADAGDAAGARRSRRPRLGQAIRQAARGIIAATPVELPVMQAAAAAAGRRRRRVSGTELPVPVPAAERAVGVRLEPAARWSSPPVLAPAWMRSCEATGRVTRLRSPRGGSSDRTGRRPPDESELRMPRGAASDTWRRSPSGFERPRWSCLAPPSGGRAVSAVARWRRAIAGRSSRSEGDYPAGSAAGRRRPQRTAAVEVLAGLGA